MFRELSFQPFDMVLKLDNLFWVRKFLFLLIGDPALHLQNLLAQPCCMIQVLFGNIRKIIHARSVYQMR